MICLAISAQVTLGSTRPQLTSSNLISEKNRQKKEDKKQKRKKNFASKRCQEHDMTALKKPEKIELVKTKMSCAILTIFTIYFSKNESIKYFWY